MTHAHHPGVVKNTPSRQKTQEQRHCAYVVRAERMGVQGPATPMRKYERGNARPDYERKEKLDENFCSLEYSQRRLPGRRNPTQGAARLKKTMESERKVSGNILFYIRDEHLWKHSAMDLPRKSCALVRERKKWKSATEAHAAVAAGEAVKLKNTRKLIDRRRKGPPEISGQEKVRKRMKQRGAAERSSAA